MAYGRCGAPGCGGRYIGRGTCTNPRCVDPHGPGRQDHPEHRTPRWISQQVSQTSQQVSHWASPSASVSQTGAAPAASVSQPGVTNLQRRRDHPEHWHRRRSRSPRHRSRSPYPLPKRLPRHEASPAAGPPRLHQIREAAFALGEAAFAFALREAALPSSLPETAPRCVACMERKPQVRLEPCGCAVVCRHCVGVIMAIATDNNEDILPQCPHCRAGFHGVNRVTTLEIQL